MFLGVNTVLCIQFLIVLTKFSLSSNFKSKLVFRIFIEINAETKNDVLDFNFLRQGIQLNLLPEKAEMELLFWVVKQEVDRNVVFVDEINSFFPVFLQLFKALSTLYHVSCNVNGNFSWKSNWFHILLTKHKLVQKINLLTLEIICFETQSNSCSKLYWKGNLKVKRLFKIL